MRPAPPPRPRRAPLWTLPLLVALLGLPSGLALPLLGAALAVWGGTALVRSARAQRSPAESGAGPGDVLLGRDAQGTPVVLAESQLAAHALLLGASGAGKTTSLLQMLTERIRAGGPVVAIDMKASPQFERTLRAACEAAGRPLRVWRPEGPVCWNPLAHGNATELKDKLIGSERFSEPHYKRQAERYLQLALGVLADRHPGRAPDLDEVLDALEPRRLARLASELTPQRARQIGEYVAALGPDGTSAVRGLATRLALLAESHAGPFLRGTPAAPGAGEPPIDLRRALDGEAVVLFSLNSSTLGGLAAQLGTLAVQDLISATGSRLDGPRPRSVELATVGIDEFSGLGGDHVEHLLARGRESGVSVMLATQELADLERAGRGFADQVVGVTALKVIHRQDVPASARKAAEMAGSEQVWDETLRFGGNPLSRRSRDAGTRRVVERLRVHPDTIASLPTGEALVITKIPVAQARLVWVVAPALRSARGLEAPAPASAGGPQPREPASVRGPEPPGPASVRDPEPPGAGPPAGPATHPLAADTGLGRSRQSGSSRRPAPRRVPAGRDGPER